MPGDPWPYNWPWTTAPSVSPPATDVTAELLRTYLAYHQLVRELGELNLMCVQALLNDAERTAKG